MAGAIAADGINGVGITGVMTGGVLVGHIRKSYGVGSTRPAALAYIVAGVGAHEAIAHYLLMEPGHQEQYATGITADSFDYRQIINRFISN